jgi:hypothetical protein
VIVANRDGKDYRRARGRYIDQHKGESRVSIFPDFRLQIARTSRNVSDAEESFQDRHPSGHAVRDLTQDPDSTMLIGNGVVDLDPPIHWTRVQHDGVGLQSGRSFRGQSKQSPVIRGDASTGSALCLNTKKHDRINLINDRIKIVRDRY